MKSRERNSPLEGWHGAERSDGVDAFPAWQQKSLFPYWTLPKNKALKERAKELRKRGILNEVVFWKTFQDKRDLGWDIDRQVIIDNYIVDFFIAELGLVFEIDGSSHDDRLDYDRDREDVMRVLGLRIVRFRDSDVLINMPEVWAMVKSAIRERVEELKNASTPSLRATPQEGNSAS